MSKPERTSEVSKTMGGLLNTASATCMLRQFYFLPSDSQPPETRMALLSLRQLGCFSSTFSAWQDAFISPSLPCSRNKFVSGQRWSTPTKTDRFSMATPSLTRLERNTSSRGVYAKLIAEMARHEKEVLQSISNAMGESLFSLSVGKVGLAEVLKNQFEDEKTRKLADHLNVSKDLWYAYQLALVTFSDIRKLQFQSGKCIEDDEPSPRGYIVVRVDVRGEFETVLKEEKAFIRAFNDRETSSCDGDITIFVNPVY